MALGRAACVCLLVCAAAHRAQLLDSAAPTVSLPGLGSASGTVLTSFHGKPFSAFFSLPYAHPPLERFKYTTLWDDEWTEDPYDATRLRARCPQSSMISSSSSGSEDCLHVSVYSPLLDLSNVTDTESWKGRPVMVFIHGGGYYEGEAALYMPSKLLDRDVVVAVLQYRLGTLGFLYSGTAEAPGNMGLHDQILAIRWVHKHIRSFGGDPGLVTVFGQSAGGASTSLLMTSPEMFPDKNNDEDLVQHFIPMSGSCLEYWTIDHDPYNNFIKQADAAGCTSGTPDARVACMREKTMDELVAASVAVSDADTKAGGLGFIGQIPVVQAALEGRGLPIVIREDPLQAVKAGRFLQKPVMMGSVRDEGSLVMGIFYGEFLIQNGLENDTNFLEFGLLPTLTESFGIEDGTNSVSNAFELGFFPDDANRGNWSEVVGGLVDLTGMLFLKSGLWTLAHRMRDYNEDLPIYFYSFEYDSDNSLYPFEVTNATSFPIEGGVSHADDLLYLFNLPAYFNAEEARMVDRMTQLYANFARYGNPTPPEEEEQWAQWSPRWQAFTAHGKEFHILDDPMESAVDFTSRWNYNKYGYPHHANSP